MQHIASLRPIHGTEHRVKPVFCHAQVLDHAESGAVGQAQLPCQSVQCGPLNFPAPLTQRLHSGSGATSRHGNGAAKRVLYPFPRPQTGTTDYLDTPVRGVQAATDTLGIAVLKNKRGDNIQRFNGGRLLSQPCTSSRKGHLRIASTGKNYRPTDAVVRQPSIFGRIKNVFPSQPRVIEKPTQ